ncbi:hypothetical protein J2Y63_002437 [Shinella sp. BE166]|uniref:hypothetical protein n=1 Tax=Shinella sp. BE166 TaxID=3373918 RepID=UPI003EBA7BD8
MSKKSHKSAPFMCGQCKHGFNSERAVKDHINGSHPTVRGVGIFRCISKVDGPDYEESYADRAIAASLAMAMGDHTDDAWLLGE